MYYVYILTNFTNRVLYVGVTRNLIKRVFCHKSHVVQGFSSSYNVTKLVYYEQYTDIRLAIAREKQLKRWHREWKINLITQFNKDWSDLYDTLGVDVT